MHRLIADNLAGGHLLPRTIDEVLAHASRFVVAEHDGQVIGCAELAPLSPTSPRCARSWSTRKPAGAHRPQLCDGLAAGAACARFRDALPFTHQPSHFVKMGFTIVPHMWVPEKIAHDCTSCPLFRRCGSTP